MDFLARAATIVGGMMVMLRRTGSPDTAAMGTAPTIPEAKKQGIMTLKMPTMRLHRGCNIRAGSKCFRTVTYWSLKRFCKQNHPKA
jgi:hypothetical protein